MRQIQNYIRVKSLEEAYELNQKRTNSIVAGMLWLRQGQGRPINTAIDLSDLGLDGIEETEDEFKIGAMTSLRSLETHEGLNSFFMDAPGMALKDIVGVQFRNMATLGGSIWGRFGFSDVLTLFMVLDTYVELYKGGLIPLEDFAKRPADNDILVRIIVKKTRLKVCYQAVRAQATDFPILTCAMAKTGSAYRVAIGARPGRAVLLEAEEASQLAQLVRTSVKTETNMRGSAAYRKHLIEVLVTRGLEEL